MEPTELRALEDVIAEKKAERKLSVDKKKRMLEDRMTKKASPDSVYDVCVFPAEKISDDVILPELRLELTQEELDELAPSPRTISCFQQGPRTSSPRRPSVEIVSSSDDEVSIVKHVKSYFKVSTVPPTKSCAKVTKIFGVNSDEDVPYVIETLRPTRMHPYKKDVPKKRYSSTRKGREAAFQVLEEEIREHASECRSFVPLFEVWQHLCDNELEDLAMTDDYLIDKFKKHLEQYSSEHYDNL